MRGGISPYIALVETKLDAESEQDLLQVLKAIQSNSKTLLSFSYQSEIELHQFAKQLQQLLTQLNIIASLQNTSGRLGNLHGDLRGVFKQLPGESADLIRHRS